MALQNASHAEPGTFQGAVALDRFVRIARAGRFEATLREHEVRQRQLIRADQRHHRESRQSLQQRHVSVSITPVNSARRSAKEAAYAERFARMTRSIGGKCCSTSRRRISRKRRRRRLRATAFDWYSGTMIPVRA